MSNPLIFALLCALAAIAYGVISIRWILAKPAGNPRMQEIAAAVQEHGFDYLDAPIGRVGSLEVPMPYAKNLERLIIPGKDEVVAAVKETLR